MQSELVIIATDLAEFIGAALGLSLLSGLQMPAAAVIAAAGSFAILELQRRGYRSFEAVIASMLLVVVLAFAVQIFMVKPDLAAIAKSVFLPRFADTDSILLAAGILGATVMPHAIYLHSSLTQNRVIGRNDHEKSKSSSLNASILSSQWSSPERLI